MVNGGDSGLDKVEFVAAFLLGLAAIAIAWSTFQYGLWGGQQDEAYTESVRQANEAVDLLQAADTIRTLDQILFVEALTSGVCGDGEQGDPVACDQILANLSDEGAAAVDEWLTGNVSNPFESSAYLDTFSGQGEEAKLVSQQFFEEAGEANENGDNYELASTILTAVLFFGGISVVLDDRRIAWSLLTGAGVLFIGASVYVASLPLAG
jgi:hypothetical protein